MKKIKISQLLLLFLIGYLPVFSQTVSNDDFKKEVLGPPRTPTHTSFYSKKLFGYDFPTSIKDLGNGVTPTKTEMILDFKNPEKTVVFDARLDADAVVNRIKDGGKLQFDAEGKAIAKLGSNPTYTTEVRLVKLNGYHEATTINDLEAELQFFENDYAEEFAQVSYLQVELRREEYAIIAIDDNAGGRKLFYKVNQYTTRIERKKENSYARNNHR